MRTTIRDMTTKERLHKLVDELSEDEADEARLIVNENADIPEEPPEMLPAPKSWAWDKTTWGEPMPNVVAWVDRSRQGR